MVQIIISYNYEILSLGYIWENININYEPELNLLDIDRNIARKYFKGSYPLVAENIFYNIKHYKDINSKEQIKSMIKSNDLVCNIEIIFLDPTRLSKDSHSTWFYSGQADTFEECVEKGLIYKSYVLNCKFNTIDEYYGFSYPDQINYTYYYAYRINSRTGNDIKCNLGQIVKFKFKNKSYYGAIIAIHNSRLIRNPSIGYDIALLEQDEEGEYFTFWEDATIYNDDLLEITDEYNYKILEDCVINDKTADLIKFSDEYKSIVKEYLKNIIEDGK